MSEVLEGEAVEVEPTVEIVTEPEAVVHGELVPAPRREVLRPADAGEVIEAMKAYQDLLPQLLDASDYQAADGKRFVKKSGWRKIAKAFNLSVTIVSQRVIRNDEGDPVRAEVVARATAPNGQVSDGDGYCAVDESRFNKARGRQKLENDLRTTATTRAKNRAISDLVGMGEVSAEEVQPHDQGPPYGPALNDTDLNNRLAAALTTICGDDVDAAKNTYGEIKKLAGGYMPEIVAKAIIAAGGDS